MELRQNTCVQKYCVKNVPTFPVIPGCKVQGLSVATTAEIPLDLPGDHRTLAALPALLLQLQPVKQTGGGSLHSQGQHSDLDQEGGLHPDHPHAQQVVGVGARVAGRTEAALWVRQISSTP